jgi:hypothetical protein
LGRFKVYIKPFQEDGTYATDWTEVTENVDMSGIGQLKQSLDNSEYDVGIFKNSGINLTLINTDGLFSDAGQPGSIFKYRRSNSQVKVTWEIMERAVVCGFFVCGDVMLSPEETIFEGLLNDDAIKQQADEQNLSFKVLGKEGIFSEEKVPFSSIAAGDLFSAVILDCLNQTKITTLLTVSAPNIVCGNDIVTDTIASLENKTVAEALKVILLYSNSVLYVESNVVYVKARTASVSVQHTFYGQGASAGLENIIDISDFRSGLNRTFNFWTWTDTTLYSENSTSTATYGFRKKEIATDLITTTSKRQSILDALKTEFGDPKRELILRAPMDYDTIALGLLDKVSIDYPNVGIPENGSLPLWDLAVWDVAKFPNEILPITIESTAEFKILSRDVDPTNQEMVFYLREV